MSDQKPNDSVSDMKGAAVSFMDSLDSIERVLEGTVAHNKRIERKVERLVKFQYGLALLSALSILAFVSLLVMVVDTGNVMRTVQKEQLSLVKGLGEVQNTTREAKDEAQAAREKAEEAPSVEIAVDEDEGPVVVIRPKEEAPKSSEPMSSPESDDRPRPKAIRIPVDVQAAELAE